jgi:hypothetical protein
MSVHVTAQYDTVCFCRHVPSFPLLLPPPLLLSPGSVQPAPTQPLEPDEQNGPIQPQMKRQPGLPQFKRQGRPQIWPGRHVGEGGPPLTVTALGKPGGGAGGGGGGGHVTPSYAGVGYGPGLYVHTMGGATLRVCVCVTSTGGRIILLVNQMTAPAAPDVVVPLLPGLVLPGPVTGVGFQMTLDSEIVCVVMGGSVMTVVRICTADVVMTVPPSVMTVDQVSEYVAVTGGIVIVVLVDNTMGGRTSVHGG